MIKLFNTKKFLITEEEFDIGKITVKFFLNKDEVFTRNYFGKAPDDFIEGNKLYKVTHRIYKITKELVRCELGNLRQGFFLPAEEGGLFNLSSVRTIEIVSESNHFVKRKKIEEQYD